MSEKNSGIPRPPLSQILIYATGQMGWSIAIFGPATLIVYFYMPPERQSEALFPNYLPSITLFGILTVIGLLSFLGRMVDAISDPIVAGFSDRFHGKWGKRKTLFGIAMIPLAVSSFMIFMPPVAAMSYTNIYWLAGWLILFYFSFASFSIPYAALISELGHHPKDRLLISSLLSAFWAVGVICGSGIYTLQHYFQSEMTAEAAFQCAMAILMLISLVCMLIPVIFLKENQYALQLPHAIAFHTSLKKVLSNANFRTFMFSDLMYWLSITFIQTGLSYYVTLIFGLETKFATLFLAIALISSFLFYLPVNLMVNRFGKRIILKLAFFMTAVVLALLFCVDYLAMDKMAMFYFLAALVALPMACFGIIPNALIADIIHVEEHRTGINQSGMYYAVRNLMMKIGISFANLIFPSLLLLGKSEGDALGVQATVLAGVVFCIVGLLIFMRFKEVPPVE